MTWPTKRCSKCDRELPATVAWFAVRKGKCLASWCRACKRALDLLRFARLKLLRLKARMEQARRQVQGLVQQLSAKRPRRSYRNAICSSRQRALIARRAAAAAARQTAMSKLQSAAKDWQ